MKFNGFFEGTFDGFVSDCGFMVYICLRIGGHMGVGDLSGCVMCAKSV